MVGYADLNLPALMVGGVMRYIMDGITPGSFLLAVVSNDLREACARADPDNAARLVDYVFFLHNYAPPQCFGNPDRACDWIEAGGLNGLEAAKIAKLPPVDPARGAA